MATQILKTYWKGVSRGSALRIALGIAWMTLASQVAVFLPFSPVPITLGPNAAVFLGLMLGPRQAALALSLWAAMGLMGAPVFAGWQAFVSVKTGYILGYIPAAACMGWLMEQMERKTMGAIFSAALLSHIPIYILGLLWLAPYVGSSHVLAVGLVPFLPGLIIKTGILSLAASAWVRR